MVVLDASVILKWLLPEPESALALHFRDEHLKGREQIIVPALLHYEVANVLRHQSALTDRELTDLFDIIENLGLTVIHLSFLELEDAMVYARQKNISVYDAAYIVLARRMGCGFVTADEKLIRAVGESFVRPLA